jgi:hypothetical protein
VEEEDADERMADAHHHHQWPQCFHGDLHFSLAPYRPSSQAERMTIAGRTTGTDVRCWRGNGRAVVSKSGKRTPFGLSWTTNQEKPERMCGVEPWAPDGMVLASTST